jgi:DNA-binding XRE family transcriptional regulator
MEFSDKLKCARQKLNISQTAMAQELGVAFTTINRWENERVMPNYRAIKKFDEFCKKNGIKFADGE